MTAEHAMDAVLARVAAAAADDSGGVDVALLGDFLPMLTAAVSAGIPLQRRQLTRYWEAGRAAARSGIALRALADLYLSAAWRLWRHLPEVVDAAHDPAAVVLAGEVMLRGVDDTVAVLAEGYQLARRDLVRAQAAARREFVDDLLLGGTHASANLVTRAALFGLELAGPHAVVVVRAEKPFTDYLAADRRFSNGTILGAKADADALVTTKDGALVVIFAAPDRDAIREVVDGLTGSLPAHRSGGGEPEPDGRGGVVADGRRPAAPGPERRAVVVRAGAGGPAARATGWPAETG